MVDLAIGTKVRYRGKHGVITEAIESWYNKCLYCMLCDNACVNSFACLESERSDYSDVYVKEVLTNKGK